ncbi:MAG: restriction endonuclease subunit S [Sulfurimonas sp.]|nr:restriction endonuclease subunit S [Sulfurimonas sp.]
MSSLYAIPNSWKWTTLDEVFLIERGGSPRPIKSFITESEDGINWIKIGDVKKGQKYIETTKEKIIPEGLKKSRLVIEGDFILSNSMSFGRPYIMKTKGAIHDGWLVFRDATKILNKDFFYYLLSSTYIYQQFSLNASGSTVKNLNIEIVKKTNISLPPLNEQKRIVTKIEKLFANLDNSDKHLAHLEKQLKRYRESILKSTFENETVENWLMLESIFDIERGGSPRPIKSFITESEDGINWIKIGDTKVGQKYIESTKEKIIPEGLKKSRLVIEGDFILSNSMSFGRPYIMKTKGAIHDGWLVFREKMENINKDYFYYLLSSAYMYQKFSDKASGSTVKNLNKELVKKIKVPLPTTTEQEKIVNEIDKHFSIIDKLEVVVQKSIKESKRLRQSILKQAFEGKLVEQDSNDESADKLLEKIAKAKEEYKKEMSKRKKK